MPNNTPQYDPAMFAPGPSRDDRFEVKDQWHECRNLPDSHPEKEIEFFHRQMNEEIDSVECAARMLTDFPDADWDLQMCIARQCYDEARHVEMFRRIYEQRGGRVGQYPVMNFQYRIITNVQDLYGRLAIQNRTFEAEGLDAIEPEIIAARMRSDDELANLFDAQLADEISHVRFANENIAKAIKKDPSTVIRIGRALDYASRAFLQVMGAEAIGRTKYSVNKAGRLEAGFSSDEIRIAEHTNEKRVSSAS